MWKFIFGIFIASAPLVVGEVSNKVLRIKEEYARKLIHVLGACVTASLTLFMGLDEIALIGALFCLVLLIIRKYNVVTTLYEIDRTSYGELLFPVGVCSAAIMLPTPRLFVVVMLILGFSDTAATLLGKKYGRHIFKLYGSQKSLEGSVVFFVMTCMIVALFSGYPVRDTIVIAGVATLAEALSSFGTDNLTIPLSSSAAILLLS